MNQPDTFKAIYAEAKTIVKRHQRAFKHELSAAVLAEKPGTPMLVHVTAERGWDFHPLPARADGRLALPVDGRTPRWVNEGVARMDTWTRYRTTQGIAVDLAAEGKSDVAALLYCEGETVRRVTSGEAGRIIEAHVSSVLGEVQPALLTDEDTGKLAMFKRDSDVYLGRSLNISRMVSRSGTYSDAVFERMIAAGALDAGGEGEDRTVTLSRAGRATLAQGSGATLAAPAAAASLVRQRLEGIVQMNRESIGRACDQITQESKTPPFVLLAAANGCFLQRLWPVDRLKEVLTGDDALNPHEHTASRMQGMADYAERAIGENLEGPLENPQVFRYTGQHFVVSTPQEARRIVGEYNGGIRAKAQALATPIPELDGHSGSWVCTNPISGEVREFFERTNVEKAHAGGWQVELAGKHLGRINGEIAKRDAVLPANLPEQDVKNLLTISSEIKCFAQESPGAQMTVGKLFSRPNSRLFEIKTRDVNRLIEAGMVRAAGEHDERTIQVTDAGEATLEAAYPSQAPSKDQPTDLLPPRTSLRSTGASSRTTGGDVAQGYWPQDTSSGNAHTQESQPGI